MVANDHVAQIRVELKRPRASQGLRVESEQLSGTTGHVHGGAGRVVGDAAW